MRTRIVPHFQRDSAAHREPSFIIDFREIVLSHFTLSYRCALLSVSETSGDITKGLFLISIRTKSG